jgi:hypothetical protein
MVVQNLEFFDKFGKNLNLQFNTTTNIWEGTLYFEGISIYLFDNENLFILEQVGTQYKFPTITPTQSLEFSWEINKNSDIFFLYDVTKDLALDEQFISRVENKEIKYTDYIPSGGNAPLNIKVPLQVNIGFSPTDEIKFERKLNIYLNDSSANITRTKIATLAFYGEGIEEDERFGVWASNFGIKFLKEDANILKDYDIKEAFPDYKQLNQARKELLVNKEQIYPYVGTYKGLSNFVNILGYRDVLQIKEYWQNINRRSAYKDKLIMVDISDYLDDGVIDTLDLNDKNRNIKEGKQFKKTEFLALVYQFTRATDNYDDDGVPIVEETTEFTVNEIFYKLNRLNEKVKNEFLPINVKVKDIIGEFIYFQKITLKYWSDDTRIFDYSLNDPIQLEFFPGDNVNLVLRSLEPLYRRSYTTGIDFGVARINNGSKNPFEIGQKYSKSENLAFAENITEFYNQIRTQRFPDLSKRLTWENGDDPQRVIGAPIIITINPNRFTVGDLRGVKLEDLDAIAPGLDPYWTLENIDFKNYYEVNWRITKDSPNPYSFEHRGKTVDLFQISHVLPYAGKYRITVELIDFYGNTSVFSKFITVQSDMKPEIVGFTRLEDKFNYHISNLGNIQLQDFGASPLYYPKVNVLNNEDAAIKIDIYKNLIEWISFFKNRYGMGQNLYDVEIYDDNISKYVKYYDPAQAHPKKTYWGLGEDDLPIMLKDYDDITLASLYWMRLTDFVYLDDFEAGFYMRNPKPGAVIRISLFSEYIIPQFSTLDELVQILNDSDHPGIKLFNYEIINGKKSDNQYIIHAQAEYLSREMYHMLSFGGGFSPSPAGSPSPGGGISRGDEYTFFLPRKVFSHQLINYLKTLSPVFDDETMFLLAKTSDILSGAAQDPMFWVDKKYWKFVDDKQIGYLPTTIDQNAFNINDIKIFEETFAVPENGIVFFVINNLDGKNEFFWKLTNIVTGEEIKVKSVPFFVWKFKDLGNFTLSIEVLDNRNTSYVSEVQNFIRVLDKRSYTMEVEDKLNARKLKLLKSRA